MALRPRRLLRPSGRRRLVHINRLGNAWRGAVLTGRLDVLVLNPGSGRRLQAPDAAPMVASLGRTRQAGGRRGLAARSDY
jgi:hypothetical protein